MSRIPVSIVLLSFVALAFTPGCGEPSTGDLTQGQALGHSSPSGDSDDGDRAHCDEAANAALQSKPHKVTICHIPPGNPGNAHTINISKRAVRAHLNHGDVLDGCGCTDEPDVHPDPDEPQADPTDEPQADPTDVPGGDQIDIDPSGDPQDPAPSGATPDSGEGALCDFDQGRCETAGNCSLNQACDMTSLCCVDVFL